MTPPTTINPKTGTFTFGGYQNSSLLFLEDPNVLAFDQAGNLWVDGNLDDRLGALALTSSGLGVTYGDTIIGTQVYGMAVDATGKYIWMGARGAMEASVTSGASAATLDGTTTIGSGLGGGSSFNVIFDSDGYLWAKSGINKKLYYLSGTSGGYSTATVSSAYTSGSILAAASAATAGSTGGVFGWTRLTRPTTSSPLRCRH